MAQLLRVTCIKHTGSRDANGHILGIGGAGWYYTEDQAVQIINSGQAVFYVSDGRNSANVIVYNFRGHQILRTTADDSRSDNLLSLPPCP